MTCVVSMLHACLQAKLYPRLLAGLKPGATLGLSHGFLLGVLQNDGVDFRNDINVILMAPKVQELLHAQPCNAKVLHMHADSLLQTSLIQRCSAGSAFRPVNCTIGYFSLIYFSCQI